MSLVASDGSPLVPIGVDSMLMLNAGLPNAQNVTMDAAKEACINIGHIVTEDGADHTLDTTGSSSIGWKTGATTFGNAGTSFKVGVGTVDATTGPATRATHVSDVITHSVSKTLTGGGGGITANAWQTHVPDAGSMLMANGDLVAISMQMVTRGGAVDSVIAEASSTGSANHNFQRPAVTAYTTSYSAQMGVPNCLITFRDGALGWLLGSSLHLTASTALTWSSASSPAEYGNYILRPYPMRVYGIVSLINFTADCDLVLYTNPLGTPAAAKTISVDANQTQVVGARWGYFLFPTPYDAAANQPLAVTVKPGASSVSANYKSFQAASHAKTEVGGTNIYEVSRASGGGAFAAVNANKDKLGIGLLVGAFDAGTGGGYPASRILTGM